MTHHNKERLFMKIKAYKYALLLTGSLLLNAPTWATDFQTGMLVNTCAGCHGPEGSSVGPATPTIAGMAEDSFVESMLAFKSDERPSTIMGRIARGYTDDEINQMAGYFKTLTFQRAVQPFDEDKAKRGQKLHKKHCEKCHVEGGRKDEDGSSILAGQWKPYLDASFAEFQEGTRNMPKKMKKRMKKMVKQGGDTAIEDVIHYYISQQK